MAAPSFHVGKHCIVSGMQPTGIPHLGNYLGALRAWSRLQHPGSLLEERFPGTTTPAKKSIPHAFQLKSESSHKVQEDIKLGYHEASCFFFIADLHALTVPTIMAPQIQKNCRNGKAVFITAAAMLATGLDKRSVVFRQSQVPGHTDLAWILSCLTPTSRLTHLPQWKTSDKGNVGRLTYPVLQAADILLYRATKVPVGEDQAPHLELAQDLAESFNHHYGPTFPIPQPLMESFPRIRSLSDPRVKMSKSDPSTKGTIFLTDSDDTIARKIRKAVTDSIPEMWYDSEKRPGISNLLCLHAACRGLTLEQAQKETVGLSTAQYKEVVCEAVLECVRGPRECMAQLLAEPAEIERTLQDGEDQARHIANATTELIRTRTCLI
uniref:tryptophan--tRNA ligase n=1 Tax=Eptatretus burgeri TaxID=7764 RepID=A0A8C4Q7Z4_EPTBU